MTFRHLIPAAAVAAYFAAGLTWLAGRAGRGEGAYPPGSVHEPSEEGASLAYEYLRRRGVAVSTLLTGLEHASVPAGAVVFRLRPQPSLDSRPGTPIVPLRERAWLEGGGRLVLAVHEDYASVEITQGPKSTPPHKVFPAWPRVRALYPSARGRLESGVPSEAVTLFADDEQRPVMVRWVVGAGEVVLMSCPEIFANARIDRGDHLALLETLADRGRPVLFDEAVHGLGDEGGFGPLLLEWRLGPVLVLAAAVFVLALWRSHARLGPAEEDHEETRSEAVDLVDSVALLYDRGLGRGQLLALYYDALRRQTALRTGLKGTALDARLGQLTGGLTPPNPAGSPGGQQFDRALQAINQALDRMEDHAHTH